MRLLSPNEILDELAAERPLLDVRSPAEFAAGHVPGAVSMPLFSNEERAEVGTIYKKKGPQAALLRGLDIVGPKMSSFLSEAAQRSPSRAVAVHCWRGGQRSRSVAQLLAMSGFETAIMAGGYKAFRREALDFFEKTSLPLRVLGGKTGSGKTKVLHKMAALGAQTVDLEALAHHKGSAFGSLGEADQPTVEQFENELFCALKRLDLSRPIWVENESRSIGRVFQPNGFWKNLKAAPLIVFEIPDGERIKNLVDDYASAPVEGIARSFKNIEKKLGGQHLKAALEAVEAGDAERAARLALSYYDKTYAHGLETSAAPRIERLFFERFDSETIARGCLEKA